MMVLQFHNTLGWPSSHTFQIYTEVAYNWQNILSGLHVKKNKTNKVCKKTIVCVHNANPALAWPMMNQSHETFTIVHHDHSPCWQFVLLSVAPHRSWYHHCCSGRALTLTGSDPVHTWTCPKATWSPIEDGTWQCCVKTARTWIIWLHTCYTQFHPSLWLSSTSNQVAIVSTR